MIPIFLIGGGWNVKTFSQTYGRFLKTASAKKQPRISFVIAEDKNANQNEQFSLFLRFFEAFEKIGLEPARAFRMMVSAENPLSKEKLNKVKPTGVFVCGGLTPDYYKALCIDKTWLEYLLENTVAYAGFSAGSAIAADKAIIGGFNRRLNDHTVQIVDENAGEDLEMLDVREGLGLVKFSIDVHATQWGTLSRLVHTIDAGLSQEGWAIDENTMLEIFEDHISVYGSGNVYRARRNENQTIVDIFQAGVVLP